MLKQLVLPFVAVAAFIVLVGLLVKNSSSVVIPGFPIPAASAIPTKSIKVGDTTIQVEIANTPETRAQGLSGRTDLLGNSGMLFTFDANDKTPIFWMKDMLFPLDLIWIRDGVVIKIDKNVPFPSPGTQDANLPKYSPNQTVDHVLEVRGGYSDQNGITTGNKVTL